MEDVIEFTSEIQDKHAFINPTEEGIINLQKQLEKEIKDGLGESFLVVGIGDNQSPGLTMQEMQMSVSTIERLADNLSCHLIHLRDRHLATSFPCTDHSPDSHTDTVNDLNSISGAHYQSTAINVDKNESAIVNNCVNPLIQNSAIDAGCHTRTGYFVREYLLRRKVDADDFLDVRVAVVGNVDAGKSTLLGVLTYGELDDGRGLARLHLLRHKHETESGRTTSVGSDILGFSSSGKEINRPLHGNSDWGHICKDSSKVISFIDLAGHERYLKTTIFGMTGHAPDYVMLIIGANAGVIGMTKEHLGLALALCVPVFAVVTKIDMCPQNVLQETMQLLLRILKSPGCRKMPVIISSRDDVICCATNFTSERMCPIFSVSNVKGTNLDLLKLFLNLLPPRSDPQLSEAAYFQIDGIFLVPGVGTVVSGTCLAGQIHINDSLSLGPDSNGQFQLATVKSIHRKRLPVNVVSGGQTASFALKKIRRNQVRKGMVMLGAGCKQKCCMEFIAELLILHHPTTISVGYQAMVHVGAVRQTASITQIDKHERLRTGDKDLVTFRFIKQPEYLRIGTRLIYREGKTKAVGTVKEVVPLASTVVNTTSHPKYIRKHHPNPQLPVTTSRTAISKPHS